MSLDALRETIPAYAKDLSLNLSSLASETVLSDQQKWGTFLACAHAVGTPAVVRAFEAEAEARLEPAVRDAAKSAAAIMGMNNVYYRALHLMANREYATLPARLCTAVSAVNGCGACVDAHEKTLRDHGVTNTRVQAALRIGAVVNAVSRVLAAEAP